MGFAVRVGIRTFRVYSICNGRFCSVTFDEGYKSYYYLTEDDSIEIGDFVLVPAGKDNHEAVVEAVRVLIRRTDCTAANMPYPGSCSAITAERYTAGSNGTTAVVDQQSGAA